MADEDYAAMLAKARKERNAAGLERLELNKRIEQLDAIITALRTLVEQPRIDPAKGITEGIKAALKAVLPQGSYPTTIRGQLERAGFDFSKQTNPMASIHAILKRLEAKGHIQARTEPGKTGVFYLWVSDKAKKPEAKEGVK